MLDQENLDAAFYDKLANDTELTGLLASYAGDDASVSRPAIFTDEEVPEDAEKPYIWTYGLVSHVPDDDKNGTGALATRDIGCYVARNETTVINRIVTRVRELFHRELMDITGAQSIIQIVSGPINAPTDDNTLGKILTVRLRYVDD